ncbi:MAG TPA: RNA polymerase sigma factor [Candidatus Polarisedimenticolia bacterium]|nr:RNA polymerase sigma factor [Candidatus Polarisedimenticolia bacterium]
MAPKRTAEEEISAFLAGDPVLHELIRAGVRRAVRSLRFAPAVVEEEIVQETLTRVFVSLSEGSFRGEASLATFAQRVARYVYLEQIRRRRFVSEIASAESKADPRAGPEEHFLRAEEHRRNLRTLVNLTPECRELFRLIFVEELNYAEVGARLGISDTAVKLRVHRCRLTMRSAEPGDGRAGERMEPMMGWRHYEKAKE